MNISNTKLHLYCVNMPCQFGQKNWLYKGILAWTKPVIARKMSEGRPLFPPLCGCASLVCIVHGYVLVCVDMCFCAMCVRDGVTTHGVWHGRDMNLIEFD